MSVVLNIVLVALTFLLIDWILPGVSISTIGVAFLAALVFGLVNLIVRPIVMLLTLPLNLLTLGLFSFIVNALMFGLTAMLVPGFVVDTFVTALLGALILALVTAMVSMMTNRRTFA